VPVDRRVRIGLVGPVMVRPAAGVWLRSFSRPLPPRLAGEAVFAFALAEDFFGAAARFRADAFVDAEVFLDAAFLTRLRAVFAVDFRVVFRLAAFLTEALRAAPFLARDGAFLTLARRLADDFRAAARPLAVDFAFAAPRFFAGVLLLAFLRVVFAMCASERSGVEFDRWPLSVVSSSAYLTCR
jgi:hypothetical protein